jgi:hypothetical protein
MRSVKKIALLLVVLTSGLAAFAPGWAETDARQQGNENIVVEQLGGSVEVTAAGIAVDASVGSSLELPSRIVTGSDGNIAIRQSRTGVAIAPDSDVEIPASARDGQLIARMIQHRGTAFYDVEPRPVEKLRIETPYLVAVVKGTQFSVLVESDGTTVSLFEGLLELRSTDDVQVVELAAGQIAIARLDGAIRILPMDADSLEAAVLRQDGAVLGAQGTGTVAALADASNVDAITTVGETNVNPRAGLGAGDSSPTGTSVDVGLYAGADVGGGSVNVGLETGLDAGVDAGGGSVDVGLDAGLDAGADLGGGSVDVGLDTGLDAGADLGGGSVDVGLDAGLDAGADLGGGSVDVGLDTSLDVGTDIGTDVGVEIVADLDVGALEIDAGIDADLDLGDLDLDDTLEDLLDTDDDSDDTEDDDSLLPDLPLPLF